MLTIYLKVLKKYCIFKIFLQGLFIMQQLSTEASTARLGEESRKEQYKVVRNRYRADMLVFSKNNKKRVDINLDYCKKCAKIFNIIISDVQMAIICDDLITLKTIIEKNPERINETIQGFPLVYIAARSGNCDIAEYLLSRGCSLNFKKIKSTPMHVASYFGHQDIIKLLIKYGVSVNQDNFYGNTPEEQAGTPIIKEILNSAKQSFILDLSQNIGKLSNPYPIINIIGKNGDIIIKKIITKDYFSYFDAKNHANAFHGTHYEKLQSIVKHGLKKPGQEVDGRLIIIPPNHIRGGIDYREKVDWSNAVFSSPSIYYATNKTYSKKLVENDVRWLPVCQLKIKEGSYNEYENTVPGYQLKSTEPQNVEFRVERPRETKQGVNIENIVVIAVVFVRKQFLDNNENYDEVTNIVLNSKEESIFRLGRPNFSPIRRKSFIFPSYPHLSKK